MASISVVIPTYNGAAYIREAIASVLTQTLLPAEIIVVDDCSKDETTDLVTMIAQSAPIPVRLIRLGVNSGGPATPLNVGVEAASSGCVAVLDQDDLFHPTKLAEQISLLEANPDLTCVMGCSADLNDLENRLQNDTLVDQILQLAQRENGAWKLPGPSALRLLLALGTFVNGYPAFVFRRRDWLRKGGADKNLRIASDYDLLCWLATQGSLGFLPQIHYFRRRHEANLTRNRTLMFLEIAFVRTKYLTFDASLRHDPLFDASLRSEFLGMVYWLRQAGHHRLALKAAFFTARVWGWDMGILSAVAKVIPHWVFSRLARQTPSPFRVGR